MKNSLFLFLLTLFLTISISKADDYVWGEEFKEGDIISAATFNQIFNTIEKINPSPSKRQQKILLYNIIEVINIYPYYTQKTEDDIAKYHSEDEFKYRKINSLLR